MTDFPPPHPVRRRANAFSRTVAAALCGFFVAGAARAWDIPDISPPRPAGAPDGFGVPISPATGMDPVESLIKVDLLAESDPVAAGQPFTVALRLRHRRDAHSAWLNPGGPGNPTRVEWTLPEGFSVDDGRWPEPVLIHNAGFVLYAYGGDALALFTVTPPASWTAGSEAELKARVTGQACTDTACAPFAFPAALRVAAAEIAGPARATVTSARQRLPAPPTGWTFAARRAQEGVALELFPGPEANRDLGHIYFYDQTYPDSPVDSQQGQLLSAESDRLRLLVPLQAGAAAPERLQGVLVAPEGWLSDASTTSFLLDAPVVPSEAPESFLAMAPARQGRYGVGAALLFAFLGGLLLNVMPCVFPVLSLKVMAFIKHAHEERGSILAHGLMYGLGVLLSFWALAALVIGLGRAWGAWLQSPWTIFLLCHLFLAIALNLAGVFEVGLSSGGYGGWLRSKRGLHKSFGTGLMAAVVATPCSAPFLATALAYALSLSTPMALGVFTFMALGFALPYLLLALAPGWLKKLPKPGAWTQLLHQALSFPLFATAAYLLWCLDGMVPEGKLLMAAMGLVLAAFAFWAYGKCQPFDSRRRAHRVGLAAAVVCLAGGLAMGMPPAAGGLAGASDPASGPAWPEPEWLPWSPELVAELRERGQPVYVDFTARWCATCQFNKRIYGDQGLRKAIRERNVALLRADWTTYDERITATLRDEFGKAAVPVAVVYLPGQPRGLVLPEVLWADGVREALEQAPLSPLAIHADG